MNPTTQSLLKKTLTATSLIWLGLIFLTGCQSKTGEDISQQTEPSAPKSVEPPPQEAEPVEEEPAPEPQKRKPSPKGEPELPPAPPSTQELALEELKKRGGKAVQNRNDDVVEVVWQGPEVTDNDLVILQKFPYLRKLDLTDTSITDAGLKHLNDLEYLRYLFLLGTSITDDGVAELQGHSRLEQLCLDDTLVTDKGVKFLESLSRLVMLHLATEGEITDASIDSLIQLKDLKELKLEGTKITEDGKAKLVKALPDLEFVGGPDGAIPVD